MTSSRPRPPGTLHVCPSRSAAFCPRHSIAVLKGQKQRDMAIIVQLELCQAIGDDNINIRRDSSSNHLLTHRKSPVLARVTAFAGCMTQNYMGRGVSSAKTRRCIEYSLTLPDPTPNAVADFSALKLLHALHGVGRCAGKMRVE